MVTPNNHHQALPHAVMEDMRTKVAAIHHAAKAIAHAPFHLCEQDIRDLLEDVAETIAEEQREGGTA